MIESCPHIVTLNDPWKLLAPSGREPSGKSQRMARPIDLVREHGLSTQAVRNYETAGILPPAERSASGYRHYTAVHAGALRAFLALWPAFGYAEATAIMQNATAGRLDAALRVIDASHGHLARDRETVGALARARRRADADTDGAAGGRASTWSIGDLAHRLGVTTATLRSWERAGVLRPTRDPFTGFRVYRAGDVADADLARLLRRSGQGLDAVRRILEEIRAVGGGPVDDSIVAEWQARITARGVAMVHATASLSLYLSAAGLDLPRLMPPPAHPGGRRSADS